MLNALLRLFGINKDSQSVQLASQPGSSQQLSESSGVIRVADVFTHTVYAPYSYVDRALYSAKPTTRQNIRLLKSALEREGKIVGVWGPSKSGKTMFAVRTVRESGWGYVIAEGTEINSVEGFWRHLAEQLKIKIQKYVLSVDGQNSMAELTMKTSAGFAIGDAGFAASVAGKQQIEDLVRTETQSEVLTSVRKRCLEFLEAARMCVLIDDFDQVTDDTVRKALLTNVKIPATQNQGKFVFVCIRPETLFVGEKDEQLIGRSGIFEFPHWEREDLEMIARLGFDRLGIGYGEKSIIYIERNSFFNPMNIQEICLNVCDACGFQNSGDVPPGYVLPMDKVEQALSDFARGLSFFDEIIRRSEQLGGAANLEKSFAFMGVNLNIYQMVFLALSTGAASSADGINLKTIRDKIKPYYKKAGNLGHLEAVLKAMAQVEIRIEYERLPLDGSASRRPLLYDAEKKNLRVHNPMLRVYLLRGYVPGLGLDPEAVKGQFRAQ